MARIDEKHIVSGNAIVVWDGITQPENNDQGKLVHSLKVAILPSDPSVAELEQIATAALQADPKFRGTLPPGGCWPLNDCDPSKIEGKLAGYKEFNTKTYNGAPQVFDTNGKVLSPMQYGQMLYPGAIVKVLTHAYSFDNKSKGVAFGLDGIQVVDATQPRLPVGAGIDANKVFGAGAAAAPPAYAPPAAPGVPSAPAAGGMFPSLMAAAPPAAATQPAPSGPAPAPHPGFVAGAGQPGAAAPPTPPAPAAPAKQMTAAANGVTYDAYIGAGWTDEQLIANGLMTA